MSYARVIAYNTATQTVGKVAIVVISFFLFRLIARYLGVAGVGEYTTIFAWSNFLAILADLGFQIIMVRELAATPNEGGVDRIASTIVSMRTAVAMGVFVIGVLISQLMPYATVVKTGIVVGSVAVFWLSVNSTLVGIFQANFRMDKAVLTDLIGRVLTLGGVAYVVAYDLGLLAIMVAYVMGNFINLVLSYCLVRRYVSIHFQFDWLVWQRYFKDALALGAILIFAYIYFRVDALLLSLMKSSYDVGIYGVPYKVIEIILYFPALFLGVVFPLLAKYGATDRKRLERIFYKAQDVLVLIGLPVTVGIIMLAAPIVKLISGPEFLTASSVTIGHYPVTAVTTLQILMIAAFFSYLSHPYNYVLTAHGLQNKLVGPNVFYAVFNIVLNLALIPFFSYLAAAVMTVATELLVWLIPRYLTRKLLGLGGFSRLWGASGLACLAMGLVVWWLRDTFLLWPIITGGVVYVGVLWLVGGIDREMVRELISSPIR